MRAIVKIVGFITLITYFSINLAMTNKPLKADLTELNALLAALQKALSTPVTPLVPQPPAIIKSIDQLSQQLVALRPSVADSLEALRKYVEFNWQEYIDEPQGLASLDVITVQDEFNREFEKLNIPTQKSQLLNTLHAIGASYHDLPLTSPERTRFIGLLRTEQPWYRDQITTLKDYYNKIRDLYNRIITTNPTLMGTEEMGYQHGMIDALSNYFVFLGALDLAFYTLVEVLNIPGGYNSRPFEDNFRTVDRRKSELAANTRIGSSFKKLLQFDRVPHPGQKGLVELGQEFYEAINSIMDQKENLNRHFLALDSYRTFIKDPKTRASWIAPIKDVLGSYKIIGQLLKNAHETAQGMTKKLQELTPLAAGEITLEQVVKFYTTPLQTNIDQSSGSLRALQDALEHPV